MTGSIGDDPFDTATLRASVLAAWGDSPTRFREDANAEEDLRLGGYADTWCVELAQNAADAARAAGVPGRVRIAVEQGELRVANTGTPLDAAGVTALAALRASAKRDGASVGRFGVGFAAVLALSDAPRVVTGRGGVAFSAAATADAVRELPGPAAELARRDGQLPVLRLVWPTDPDEPSVPDGYATEVRLPLRAGLDAQALLAAATAAAPDLLLALPDLVEITVGEMHFGATVLSGGAEKRTMAPKCGPGGVGVHVVAVGDRRWLLVRGTVAVGSDGSGDGAAETAVEIAVEQRDRRTRSFCWALPLRADDSPDPLHGDVLHAPTATTERLALPARLIADVPLDPDRRRVRAAAATDAVLRAAADAYLDLVAAVAPAARLALVPAAGFPRSELDGRLRASLLDALREAAWLPGADGTDVAPRAATVLDVPETAALPALLADVVPGLLAAPLGCGGAAGTAARLAELGVHRMGAAELVDRLLGVARPAAWWRAVYAALEPAADTVPGLRDELRALPVPLADGRTVPGPASVLLPLGALPAGLPTLPGLHIADPDAVHPLLLRLGATLAEPVGLLDHPAVRDAVDRSLDDADAGLDPVPLARAVLALVDELGPAAAAGRDWLAGLALTDVDGEPARADELLLADAALAPLLADDAPLTVLAPEWERCASRDVLVAVGIVDGFTVLEDDDVGAPEHGLDDVDRWIDELAEPPAVLLAVRDLDLIREDAWPAALALLAGRPDTRAAVLVDGSYTAWWLARHARLHGHRPGHWRLPSAEGLAALYDPVPGLARGGVQQGGPTPVRLEQGHPAATPSDHAGDGAAVDDAALDDAALDGAALDDAVLAAVGVRADLGVADARDAADLLARLADPRRRPDAALTAAAHAALAAAVVDGRVDPADLDPPERVRVLDGTAADPAHAVVLDAPWWAGVLPAGEAVVGGDPRALADLLDLPTASEVVDGEVAGAGHPVPWRTLPEVVTACDSLDVPVPDGQVLVHDELWVVLHRPTPGRHRVPAWRDADGRWHAEDPVRALLGVLSHSAPAAD